jgi:hypothetical protein
MTKTRQPRRSPAVAAATPAQCPVAALADEARRLIDAYDAANEAMIDAEDDQRRESHFESVRGAIHKFIYGVVDRATFLQATSGKGALFQLCILNDLVDDLQALADPALGERREGDAEKSREMEHKISRVLYSIAGYLENVGDARLEDACSDYWMDRRYNPFVRVDEAFALLAEKGKAP